MLAEAGGSTPPDLSNCRLTADCAWHAGPKGLLTPQASEEDGDWSLPARDVGINGGSRIRSAPARSPAPASGGRAPPRRARRQLAFALLAAAAIWLLLTGIYMGSFIRTPVGAASASFRHLNLPVCSRPATHVSRCRCNMSTYVREYASPGAAANVAFVHQQMHRQDVEEGCEGGGTSQPGRQAAGGEEQVWFTEIADEHDALRRQILALQTQKVC